LIAHCVAGLALRVNNIRLVPTDVAIDTNELYGGPRFDTLSDSVQESFLDYLAERGVSDDLAYFILQQGKEKEQKEYVNWLKQVSRFTK
jgi:hypothetical protein